MSSLSSVPPLGINGISSSPLAQANASLVATAPSAAAPSVWIGGQVPPAPQGAAPANPTIQQALAPAQGAPGAPLVTMPREASEEPSLAAQTTGGTSNIGLIVILSTLGINLAMLGGFAALPLIELKRTWARNGCDIQGTVANDKLRATSVAAAAETANKTHHNAYVTDNFARFARREEPRFTHVAASPPPITMGK